VNFDGYVASECKALVTPADPGSSGLYTLGMGRARQSVSGVSFDQMLYFEVDVTAGAVGNMDFNLATGEITSSGGVGALTLRGSAVEGAAAKDVDGVTMALARIYALRMVAVAASGGATSVGVLRSSSSANEWTTGPASAPAQLLLMTSPGGGRTESAQWEDETGWVVSSSGGELRLQVVEGTATLKVAAVGTILAPGI
jgi:hypothetical protein